MAIPASNSHSIGVLEARVIMLNIDLIFIVFRLGYRVLCTSLQMHSLWCYIAIALLLRFPSS